MTNIPVIVAGVLGVPYLAVRLLEPVAPTLSAFELRRLKKAGGALAVTEEKRTAAFGILTGLRGALSAILLLSGAVVLAPAVGGFSSVVVTLVFALAIEWLLWVPVVKNAGQSLYSRAEPRLLSVAAARRYLFFIPVHAPEPHAVTVSSEAELLHVVDGAHFLETDRRELIRSALEFTGLSVADAMSGRRSITPVDKGEVLGPLLLDELFKTGKAAFVVTDGGVDDIVGILRLEKLTSLDLKDTPTALRAMSPDVHYIDADAPVTEALSYLRSAKTPFLVVRDADGTTAGLLTMDNILRCLFTD